MYRQKILVAFSVLLVLVSTAHAQRKIRDLKETVILISIDGFRDDYLMLHKPKTLNRIAKKGVRAKYMIPSFPTKTFPNHYTIATGLYPSKHGIVANNMFDPETKGEFALRKREEVQNPRWWSGEPIWVTAEKQGLKSAAFFFPGTETEIKGVRPTTWHLYDGRIPNESRVDSVLSWFDWPVEKRPQFITLYFSNVDDAGHRYSPTSKKTREAVRYSDKMIKRLWNGLKKRGIHKKVNLIVVSDHGMVKSPPESRILIDKMFDQDAADKIIWVREFTQIFPKQGRVEEIYQALKSKLPAEAQVFKKENLPARFNYQDNKRIAPIIVLPKPGWYVTSEARLRETRERGRYGTTLGRHGYDNEHETMRALFVAHGPAFKKGYVSEPFRNIEVYNLMCEILGLKPAPNDGDIKNISGLLRPAPSIQ